MNQKEFLKKYSLTKNKLELMAPYIKGAHRCSNCGEWEFKENARAIYIPHKTKYPKQVRIYCNVLNAILYEMDIHPNVSGISKQQFVSAIKNLKKDNFIVLKDNTKSESYRCVDYIVSAQYAIHWKESNKNYNKKLIIESLKTLEKICEAVIAFAPK